MDEMFEELGVDKKKKVTDDDKRNDSDLLGGLLRRPNYAEMGQSGYGQNAPAGTAAPGGPQVNQNKEVIQEEEDFSDAQEEMEESDISY